MAEHLVPADDTFETGDSDAAIICGHIKAVNHAALLELRAKFETVDVLEMLVAAHRAGPNDDFEIIKTAGLSTRVSAAFAWGAETYGLSIEGFRADFNIVARANGRSLSVDYRVRPRVRGLHAAAARSRARANALLAMLDTLFDLVDVN